MILKHGTDLNHILLTHLKIHLELLELKKVPSSKVLYGKVLTQFDLIYQSLLSKTLVEM